MYYLCNLACKVTITFEYIQEFKVFYLVKFKKSITFALLIINCLFDMESKKEIYRRLCETESSIPLFMQYWWLEAVCAGKKWDVMLSYDAQQNVRAALPYLWNERLKMKYILMPQQTQIGGVWVKPEYVNSASVLQEIAADFQSELDHLKLAYYYQHFPLNSKMPDVFAQLGFKVKNRITYRIEDLSDLDAVIDHFSKNKKRQLQKALSATVDFDLDAEKFYYFHQNCLLERKKQISYSREFFLVLYEKCVEHHQGQIIAVRGPEGQLQAAAFLVWDNNSLYYLIPTYSEAEKDSGASARLVLESIKFARNVSKAFDFEGSMISGVANHYKQFGSEAVAYKSVEKYYHWYFWFALAFNKLRNLNKF